MADEIATFNVKNVSLRLIHIGGVSIPPDMVVELVDDPKGINRMDVEDSPFLEETDEEANHNLTSETVKVEPVKKAAKTATAKNTASGAGWNAADKK